MWKVISSAAGVVLLLLISLLGGAYLDLVVHKVSSLDEIIKAFAVHYDFARSEKWRGYYVEQESNGDWTIHVETLDLTSVTNQNVL